MIETSVLSFFLFYSVDGGEYFLSPGDCEPEGEYYVVSVLVFRL